MSLSKLWELVMDREAWHLQSMGSQNIGHDQATELNCTKGCCYCYLATNSYPALLQTHGLEPTRFLCPWNSPGKKTGVRSHFLLQGIFPNQGSNPYLLCLLHWQEDSLLLSHEGSPGGGIMERILCPSILKFTYGSYNP